MEKKALISKITPGPQSELKLVSVRTSLAGRAGRGTSEEAVPAAGPGRAR